VVASRTANLLFKNSRRLRDSSFSSFEIRSGLTTTGWGNLWGRSRPPPESP
jgi:hypothetical protein